MLRCARTSGSNAARTSRCRGSNARNRSWRTGRTITHQGNLSHERQDIVSVSVPLLPVRTRRSDERRRTIHPLSLCGVCGSLDRHERIVRIRARRLGVRRIAASGPGYTRLPQTLIEFVRLGRFGRCVSSGSSGWGRSESLSSHDTSRTPITPHPFFTSTTFSSVIHTSGVMGRGRELAASCTSVTLTAARAGRRGHVI